MRCREARKKMIPFLDGELESIAEFKAHIETCDRCREELAQFRRSFELAVAGARETEIRVEPSPYLLAKLNRKIDKYESSTLWHRFLGSITWTTLRERIPEISCAVVFLILFVGLLGRVRLYGVTENTSSIPQFTEQRLELRIGDSSPIEIMSIRLPIR